MIFSSWVTTMMAVLNCCAIWLRMRTTLKARSLSKGGGVSAAGELLLGPAREQFRRQLTGRGYRPEARIEQAALGNEAGLIGAADLSRADRLE